MNQRAHHPNLGKQRVPRSVLLAGVLLLALSVPPTPIATHAQAANAGGPTATAAKTNGPPNLFDLRDDRTRTTISYSTSSIGGRPQFGYSDPRLQRSFQGSEIRTTHSEIGTLVSVTLESIPDLRTLTVTLIVPEINLERTEATFATTAILTTHRTSIGGPALVKGAVETYRTISLQGTARVIQF